MNRYDELFPYWPIGRYILPFLIDAMGEDPGGPDIIPHKDARGVRFELDDTRFQKLCRQHIPPDHLATFQRRIEMVMSDLIKVCRQEVTEVLSDCGCDALGSTVDRAAEKRMARMMEFGDLRAKALLRKHCGLEE